MQDYQELLRDFTTLAAKYRAMYTLSQTNEEMRDAFLQELGERYPTVATHTEPLERVAYLCATECVVQIARHLSLDVWETVPEAVRKQYSYWATAYMFEGDTPKTRQLLETIGQYWQGVLEK